jgi:hypothetical protein
MLFEIYGWKGVEDCELDGEAFDAASERKEFERVRSKVFEIETEKDLELKQLVLEKEKMEWDVRGIEELPESGDRGDDPDAAVERQRPSKTSLRLSDRKLKGQARL